MTSKLAMKTTGELIDEIPHLSDLDKQRLFKLHQTLDRVPLLEFQQIVWPEVRKLLGLVETISRLTIEHWNRCAGNREGPPTAEDIIREGIREDLFIKDVEIGTLGSKPLITHIFLIAEADVMLLRGDFFAKAIPINLCGLRANVFYPENGEEKK